MTFTDKINSSWKLATVQDLVFFQRGFDISKAEQKKGDVPVISSSGVKSYHSEAKVKAPGVLIGRKGTLGSVHFADRDYFPHSTTLWSKKLNGNNPRYVYYFLHTLNLERFDVGNSNPTLNRNHIHNLKIHIPPIETQKKIADILSKYDDLIENNRRRIELLEESARLLYREWFVHLRFPSHEHTPFIDGIPEGWEKKKLEEVGYLNYGKTLTKKERVPGKYSLFGSGGIIGTHKTYLVEGPGIIIGRKGSIGSVFWSEDSYYPIDTTYYIDREQSNLYLYHALKNIGFMNTDVAVPGLNRNFAHSRTLIIPSQKCLDLFETFARPIYHQIYKLNQYNKKLSQARDLLLPRLMNGEITV